MRPQHMTRRRFHVAAVALVVTAGVAVVFGEPTAPVWVRWVGLGLLAPALLLAVATVPSER